MPAGLLARFAFAEGTVMTPGPPFAALLPVFDVRPVSACGPGDAAPTLAVCFPSEIPSAFWTSEPSELSAPFESSEPSVNGVVDTMPRCVAAAAKSRK